SQQNAVDNRGGPYGTINIGSTGGTLIIGSGDTSSSFAGNFTGVGEVRKIGNGTLTLSGSSSITGGINVIQGIVRAEAQSVALSPTGNADDFAGAALATASADAILGGGSLALSSTAGNSAQIRLGRNITSLTHGITVDGVGTNIL